MKNKVEIKYTVGEGDEAVEKIVVVRRPRSQEIRNSKTVYSEAFNVALKKGALLEARLEDYMKEQGIWNDQKQEEFKELSDKLDEAQKKLAAGGIKKSEGKDLALQIRILRAKWTRMLTATTGLREHTAEGQADNARFDYLCSVCIVDEAGEPLFNDVEDYLANGDEEHIYKAAAELANMDSAIDPDWEKNLPENKFLLKYKFVNEELSLVNKDNQLIDLEGRLINKDGMLIDEDGNLIDSDRNLISEEEKEPVFFDDDEDTEENTEDKKEEPETTEEEENTSE